jgi:NifU-like protein involved in Fe-S cluster formation
VPVFPPYDAPKVDAGFMPDRTKFLKGLEGDDGTGLQLRGLGCSRDTSVMYSDAVLDHFQNPRNVGTLDGATATISVENPVCGDILELSARMDAGRIAEARFRTRGCVTAVACSSLLTELLHGKTPAEARVITPEQISETLGGLPPATFHAAQLARDAAQALLTKLR